MKVNCNICNKVIDHAESFFDDEEDVFICLNCQEERIKRLLEANQWKVVLHLPSPFSRENQEE